MKKTSFFTPFERKKRSNLKAYFPEIRTKNTKNSG